MGVPLNSLESSTLRYCMVTDDKNAHLADAAAMGLCDGIYGADDLAYLGQIQADFSEKIPSGLHPVEDTDNGYIDAVAGYVTEKLAQEGEYGKYVIYLNDMYRVQREKRSFGETECYMDCVIDGNGRSEYAEFIIYDHGDIDGSVFPLSGPHLADSQGYFSDYHAGDENGEYIRKIIERKRGTVALEVTGQAEENTKESDDDQNPDCDSAVDFRELPAGEIARWLSYVCSYSEWFGLTELGSVAGEFGRFNGQQIVMYSWTNTGEALFFVPMDRVNTCLKKADGEICPVYVNEMGNMEFYKLDSRQFIDNTGQMDTSLIETENLEPCLIESFTKISETEKIVVEELTNFEMPPIENDMFVMAFARQVGELLKQADRKGTYTVRIGEYESVCSNQVCISAAVTGGQDEYYIRYLIVRYGDDRYFFWPAGFGTDESLEECAGKKHDMNQTCIERTKLLNRTEIKIEGNKNSEEKSMRMSIGQSKKEIVAYSEIVKKILEKRSEEEIAFLDKYPTALRWIRLSSFDFSGDGVGEIILSDEYVETSSIISYNQVYDVGGKLLFRFVAGDIRDTEIFMDEVGSQYHIQSSLHIAAGHDVTFYEKIFQRQKQEWKTELMFIEWDCRHGKEREDTEEKGYFIYDCFTEDETANIMETGYENTIDILNTKKANGTKERLEKYVQSFKGQHKEKVTDIGIIVNWEEGIEWAE